MSEKQSEAQRLADALEQGTYLLSVERDATAAELRRLDAENEKLREENGVLQYALTAYKDMELHLHAEQDRAENLEAQLEAVEKQRDQMQQAGQQALNALQVLCDEYGRQMTAMNHKTPRRAKWTAALSAISALSQALEADHVEYDLNMVQQAEPVDQLMDVTASAGIPFVAGIGHYVKVKEAIERAHGLK